MPKFDQTPTTDTLSRSKRNKEDDDEDNQLLFWVVRRRMVIPYRKGKENISEEQKKRSCQFQQEVLKESYRVMQWKKTSLKLWKLEERKRGLSMRDVFLRLT